jgi:uncharacterized protein
MISTVIIKPTRNCNANCQYCSAPPTDNNELWSFSDFRRYFDSIAAYLHENVTLIWHGGEPMLLGPEFYEECYDYALRKKPHIRFSMQSNILLYDSRWKDVIFNIMKGCISTSFDPDETSRKIKTDAQLYSERFFCKLKELVEDGFHPLIVGTYTDETIPFSFKMYELASFYEKKEGAFSLRFNYRYPLGRVNGIGQLITPQNYGQMLIDLYNIWIRDLPDFVITPLDQMLLKVTGEENRRCPWTSSCTGRFLGIEPNGDIYNCSDFANLDDALSYCLGNLNRNSIPEMMSSEIAVKLRRRTARVPIECIECEHYLQCEGGCMRESVLFGNGLYGKFHYCEAWKMVFTRIKESLETGEADAAAKKYSRIQGKKNNRYRKRY